MSNISISKAQLIDCEIIGDLLLEFYNLKNKLEAVQTFIEEITKKSINYLILKQDQEYIGFVAWTPHGLPKHGLFELTRICLKEKYKGKGYGKILFRGVINEAILWYEEKGSSIRKLFLCTHENNVSAQKFYEKMGMNHEASLKSHYYTNMDELVYSMFF